MTQDEVGKPCNFFWEGGANTYVLRLNWIIAGSHPSLKYYEIVAKKILTYIPQFCKHFVMKVT